MPLLKEILRDSIASEPMPQPILLMRMPRKSDFVLLSKWFAGGQDSTLWLFLPPAKSVSLRRTLS